MALIVLGAGATRGASFVKGEHIVEQDKSCGGTCLPPLDSDFFTQLQRIQSNKHKEVIDATIEDAVDFFGHNFSITLETMFTTIEHKLRMIGLTGERWGVSREKIGQKRTNLMQAMAAVLEESLTTGDTGGHGRHYRNCQYHEKLVEQIRRTDAIVSMNYDCLIDHTLKECANGKWNARYGYRLPRPPGRYSKIGEQHWNPDDPSPPDKTLRLLKLHGSLHFADAPQDRWRLKQRPYTKQRGNLHFQVIPPEWNKQFDQGIFRSIWAAAAEEIHRSTTIVVIGYSFPLTDLHTSALFRVSVCPHKLKNLIIVNPDHSARYRTQDILRKGMQETTRVMVFDSFENFMKAPRNVWDQ